MKLKLFCIAALASTLSFAGLAQAATYTIDFDGAVERASATGTFAVDSFEGIDAASMDVYIRGKTVAYNRNGYGWYYDPNIDLSIAGTQVLNDFHLGGDFAVLHFDLGADALNYMIANQSLSFDISAQSGYWWSDLSPWGGYTNAPFYLDSASLSVTPSNVPLPGAAWLFGSGFLGLIGISKRKKAVA